MKFGIDKCAVLELERGRSEGIELPEGERMKEVDQQGYKYIGEPQLDETMNKEVKESAWEMSTLVSWTGKLERE